jgi:hypothetical protein
MGVAAEDQALYAVVSGMAPASIGEVIAVMEQIDGLLDVSDGLKWFNQLYLTVTKTVDVDPPVGGWQDAAWLLGLDVVFAGFYLNAVAACLRGDADAPGSWMALMQARRTGGIDRIQFALAGMNAHINHDLALALLAIDAQQNVIPALDGPQHADYEAVNGILNAVMPGALNALAADKLGVLAEDTGKVGRLLAFWDLCRARNLAWDFAVQLRILPSLPRAAALRMQDQMTGVVGRAILAFR